MFFKRFSKHLKSVRYAFQTDFIISMSKRCAKTGTKIALPISLPSFLFCFVFLAPVFHCFQNRAERIAEFGKRVNHARRHFGECLAHDEAVFFERAQVVGQHFLADRD